MINKRKGCRVQGQVEQKAKLDSASEIRSELERELWSWWRQRNHLYCQKKIKESKLTTRRQKERTEKENKLEREKTEYTELNKTVRTKVQTKIMKETKLYFKVVEDQNRYTKEDQRKRYVKWKMKKSRKQTGTKY